MGGSRIQIAQEHLVHSAKEAFDAASTLRLARRREHEPDLQVCCDLLQMLRPKVRSVVGIQNVWNTADLPVRITLSPDALA